MTFPAQPLAACTRFWPAGEKFGTYRYNDLSTKLWVNQAQPVLIREDVTGATFMGAFADEGISRLTIGRGVIIDHLQYGYSIPEPGVGLLLLAAGGFLRMPILTTH